MLFDWPSDSRARQCTQSWGQVSQHGTSPDCRETSTAHSRQWGSPSQCHSTGSPRGTTARQQRAAGPRPAKRIDDRNSSGALDGRENRIRVAIGPIWLYTTISEEHFISPDLMSSLTHCHRNLQILAEPHTVTTLQVAGSRGRRQAGPRLQFLWEFDHAKTICRESAITAARTITTWAGSGPALDRTDQWCSRS